MPADLHKLDAAAEWWAVGRANAAVMSVSATSTAAEPATTIRLLLFIKLPPPWGSLAMRRRRRSLVGAARVRRVTLDVSITWPQLRPRLGCPHALVHPRRGETAVRPRAGLQSFEQRLLSLDATSTSSSELEDEVVFVLAGQGTLAVGGEEHRLEPGAAGVRRTRGALDCAQPGRPRGHLRARLRPGARRHARLRPARLRQHVDRHRGRSFVMLCSPAVGCNSVTQFIGLIPPGRAPDHFHRYDEVIYVLDGEGVLEIDDEQAPITSPARASTCLAASSTASPTPATTSCACSASSPRRVARRGLLPGRHTRRPPGRRIDDAEDRTDRRVVWEGQRRPRQGRITAGTGTFIVLPFSLPSRIGKAGGQDEPRGAARGGARRLPDDVRSRPS